MPKNYYNILGCPPNAPYDEIRTRYQQLIKQYHPDKQNPDEAHSMHNRNRFIEIDQAWKQLRDPDLRRQYDISTLQNKIDGESIVYAELNVNKLEFERGIATFTCRCGAIIQICERDFFGATVEQCKIYYECVECSNTISVCG